MKRAMLRGAWCMVAVLLVAAVPVRAGDTNLPTVFANLRTFASAANSRAITLVPQVNPVTDGTNLYWSAPLLVYPTNGLVVISNIVPNNYTVTMAGVPGSWTLPVPWTNGYLNAVWLSTNLLTYSWNGVGSVYVTNLYTVTNLYSTTNVFNITNASGGITNGQTGLVLAGRFTNDTSAMIASGTNLVRFDLASGPGPTLQLVDASNPGEFASLEAESFSTDGNNYMKLPTNAPADAYVLTASGTAGGTKWAEAASGGGGAGTATNLAGGLVATNLQLSGRTTFFSNSGFTNPSPSIVVTNSYPLYYDAKSFRTTNSVVLLFNDCGIPNPSLPGGADIVNYGTNFAGCAIRFNSWTNTGSYFQLLYNPYHDKGGQYPGDDEMQQTSSGGWAVSTGHQDSKIDSTNYNNARRAWQWGIRSWGQPYIYFQYSMNMDRVNTNLGGSMYPMQWKAQYFSNGVQGVVCEVGDTYPTLWFKSISTNGNGAWTFYDNLSYSVDTNRNWSNQETARKRFQIIVGPDGTADSDARGVAINGSITMNGGRALTTNYALGNGATLLITNGLIMGITNFPPFAFEPEAISYLTRIGTETNSALGTNINTFVLALKSVGISTNDPVYLVCGADASTNGQNLWSTNYTITWEAALGTNNQLGLVGSANGYGDTHWQPAVTNGYMFAWIKNGGNPTAYKFLCGAQSPEGYARLLNNTSVNWTYSYSDKELSNVTPPSYPGSVCIVRSNDYLFVAKNGLLGGPVSLTATGVASTNMYVMARNSGGANYYYDGWVQGFAFGTNVLSAAQQAALYSAWTNLNAALGR